MLVVGTGSLLGDVVANIVMSEPEFHVATLTEADVSTLRKTADHAAPDVILLCQGDALDWTQTLEILKQIPAQEQLRMIVIRRDDNILEVYDKQCVELTHNADLMTFIRYR